MGKMADWAKIEKAIGDDKDAKAALAEAKQEASALETKADESARLATKHEKEAQRLAGKLESTETDFEKFKETAGKDAGAELTAARDEIKRLKTAGKESLAAKDREIAKMRMSSAIAAEFDRTEIPARFRKMALSAFGTPETLQLTDDGQLLGFKAEFERFTAKGGAGEWIPEQIEAAKNGGGADPGNTGAPGNADRTATPPSGVKAPSARETARNAVRALHAVANHTTTEGGQAAS